MRSNITAAFSSSTLTRASAGLANSDRLELIAGRAAARGGPPRSGLSIWCNAASAKTGSAISPSPARDRKRPRCHRCCSRRPRDDAVTTSICILKEKAPMSIPNRLTLDDVPTTPIGEIAALPAEQLALLQQEAADAACEGEAPQGLAR